MQFKEGDKVLFLNEKGGGVVTRIVNEEIVHVSIDEGFEIPYAVGDLIKTAHDRHEGHTGDASLNTTVTSGDHKHSPLQVLTPQAGSVPQGIYLAMVPRNQEQVLASAMDFYMVNHTGYEVSFGLFVNKSGHYQGIASGTIGPSAKRHVGKVERTEIEDWNHSLLQAVFFQEGKTEVIPPVSTHVVFKPVKIYKEENFSFSPLLHQKAMMVMVHGHGQ